MPRGRGATAPEFDVQLQPVIQEVLGFFPSCVRMRRFFVVVASWLLAGDKTEWLSPAGLRSQVQILSSHQGSRTSVESVAGSSEIGEFMYGITHVIQTASVRLSETRSIVFH